MSFFPLQAFLLTGPADGGNCDLSFWQWLKENSEYTAHKPVQAFPEQ